MPPPSERHGESAAEAAARAPQETQMRLLTEEYGDEVGKGPADWERVGIQYLYRQGHILVRDEYLDQVRRIVPGSQVAEPVVHGVTLVRVPGQTFDALARIHGDDRQTPEGDWLGHGIATPDHLVSICPPPPGTGGGCPPTEPDPDRRSTREERSAPKPKVTTDSAAGEGIRVVVVDTGLDPDAPPTHSWLDGVSGEDDLAIPRGSEPSKSLGLYAGHGTFIAGVVRTMAPRAEVIVKRILFRAGAAYESDLVRALDHILDDEFPDIISLSAGTWTFDPTGLLGLRVFHETRLRHLKGVVLVAAAGNDGSRRPFWPAAAPWTISVGALTANGRRRAGFSNFGGWVDVYTLGEDLYNAYPVGTYTYREPSRSDHEPAHVPGETAEFTGMARWSGTSFATPMVAGLIAARMSRTGENGRDAGAALLEIARSIALFGVGAVLLPR
jgi:subtilisin family serine protease